MVGMVGVMVCVIAVLVFAAVVIAIAAVAAVVAVLVQPDEASPKEGCESSKGAQSGSHVPRFGMPRIKPDDDI